MPERFLVRNGDIAFAWAAAFIAGIAAAAFSWNIVAMAMLLLGAGLAVIFWGRTYRLLAALGAVAIIFLAAAGYYRFVSARAPTVPWKQNGAAAAPAGGIFDRVLPTGPAELMDAIMTGSTGGMDPALKAAMSASGTAYIVGMYGYKINLFVAALLTVLLRVLSRRTATVIAIAAISALVVVAGAPITAVRAAIMAGLVLAARAAGRPFRIRNVFTFTATAMLAGDPLLLRDTGFQLSFMSLLGIFVLGPPLRRLLRTTGHEWFAWKSHAVMALSVNAAIAPLLASVSGGFSLAAFASNFLISIPFAAVIGLGLAIAALGALSWYCAYGLALVAEVLLSYQLWVVRTFSEFAATLPPSWFGSVTVVAVYYLLLVIFAAHHGKRNNVITGAEAEAP